MEELGFKLLTACHLILITAVSSNTFGVLIAILNPL